MNNEDAERIVVGVDGSEPSVAALKYAARMAEALGTSLEVVTAWAPPPLDPMMVIDWSPEEAAKDVLDGTVRDAFGDDPPAGLARTVNPGSPARTLIRMSESCGMLVLGSRGHGGFAGLLLGSVSAACAAHAHCPVLIVHADGAPRRAAADEGDG
ncbi:universal stress protein [Microbacterium hydrocarbonoxydans]|uniref:universal stress protein n=1 Tax=Microbacterium hydrocarbonoxydans TaxID=273678 RepID=UPI0007BC4BAD|nr:universal stress protein [Microbacterium hydrocarbonoxydans]GAT73750.1 universal stress protein [Microbacterium sp. HM58-2]